MKIIIVSDESFCNGTAQESRQLAYAKGLSELSHIVEIFSLTKGKKRGKKIVLQGVEVNFINSENEKKNFLSQKISKLKSSLKLLRLMREENKKGKIDCIIMQSFSSMPVMFLYFTTRRLNIKIIRDQAEYPFIHKPHYGSFRLFLYTNYFYRLFDGLAVVNNALMNYFKARMPKALMIKFPMIVDPSRFEGKDTKSSNDNYIAYCGSFRNNKDGIPLLIQAFKLVTGKFPGIKLYLIGDINDVKEVSEFKQQIRELKLENDVVFTGRIGRDDMPAYLGNAKILALARPNNKQAEGGFPTKLGEYLATGKPVVVTKVGEITDYLEDGVNAFLAEPDNAKSFAEKLNFALSNSERANQVGANGKKLVYTTFNYKVQAKSLAEFINNIN
jgi:glycosyltransferase involved in cell wall biosynthesis